MPISAHELLLVQGPDHVVVSIAEVQLEHVFGLVSVTEHDFLCSGSWSVVVAVGHKKHLLDWRSPLEMLGLLSELLAEP